MPASFCEPRYGLHLLDTFAAVTHIAPPSQVLPVGFVLSLPTYHQLVRPIRSLVCAGEVVDEGILEIQPAVDASLRQVIQPDSSGAFEHDGYIPDSPSPVSSSDMHSLYIIQEPVIRLSTAVVWFGASGQLEIPNCRLI